jgi:adenylosuccinate synthase
MLRQAARLNSLTELALTKLDILDGFDSIKICTGYRLDGELIAGFPDRSDLVAEVEPVYEVLPGWGSVLSDKREPGELPTEARRFLEIVEREVGIPVKVVGVGAERDDYLVWTS